MQRHYTIRMIQPPLSLTCAVGQQQPFMHSAARSAYVFMTLSLVLYHLMPGLS